MGFKKTVLEKSDSTSVQFLRSLVVGGIATGVDIGSFSLFFYVFAINEYVALALGFIFGLAINYFISAVWIFRKSQVTNRLGEFLIFAVIGLVGLGLKEGIYYLLLKLMDKPFFEEWVFAKLNELICNIIATIIVFIYNFAARKLILYRNKPVKSENGKKEEI